jgi:DMSO/TMAO reductase YedYZ molybdopterin-dependent catalytic subunit
MSALMRSVDTRRAAILGTTLGVTFTICAVTGLFSWAASAGFSWWPTRPAGLYRISQGTHVISGAISIPLLLAKLRTVAPKLIERPFVTSAAHLVERISLIPLVGGAIFMLWTGLANTAYWYPFDFFFPAAHGKMAIVVMGGLVAHIAAKITLTRQALRRGVVTDEATAATVDRRRFLGGVAVTVGIVGVAFAGSTVRPLGWAGALTARRAGDGPQGVPVNKTARRARVVDAASSGSYRLVVEGNIPNSLSLSLADLAAMPQNEAALPIACVEGWSTSAQWRGIRMKDLLTAAGVEDAREVVVESLEASSRYRRSTVSATLAADDDTLLAMDLNGQPLDLDHGYPLRLIAPNRPGVNQTKWITKVTVR